MLQEKVFHLIRKIKGTDLQSVGDRMFPLTISDCIKNHLVPFEWRARVSNSVDRVISMEIFGGKKSRLGRRPTSATVLTIFSPIFLSLLFSLPPFDICIRGASRRLDAAFRTRGVDTPRHFYVTRRFRSFRMPIAASFNG